jgi:hypothetical protein
MKNLQRDPDPELTSPRADEIDCWDVRDVSTRIIVIAKMGANVVKRQSILGARTSRPPSYILDFDDIPGKFAAELPDVRKGFAFPIPALI